MTRRHEATQACAAVAPPANMRPRRRTCNMCKTLSLELLCAEGDSVCSDTHEVSTNEVLTPAKRSASDAPSSKAASARRGSTCGPTIGDSQVRPRLSRRLRSRCAQHLKRGPRRRQTFYKYSSLCRINSVLDVRIRFPGQREARSTSRFFLSAAAAERLHVWEPTCVSASPPHLARPPRIARAGDLLMQC